MSNDPLSIFETNFNNLLGLFLGRGTSILLRPERDAAEPVTIINKLSGKALEVESASVDQAARIHKRSSAHRSLLFCGAAPRKAVSEKQ